MEYGEPTVASPQVTADGTVSVEVTLRNVGARPAHEVVQAYVRDVVTSASWADKELKAYTHVDLAAGETRTVQLQIAAADCTIVNARGERVVEPGDFELLVGPSSRDEALRSVAFTVAG